MVYHLTSVVQCRSYKGSNIALMIELLAGPLVGGAVQDKLGSRNWGNLMVALDPSILGDPTTILHNVQLMLGRVKGARRGAGVQEILLPGERGNRLAGLSLCNMFLQAEAKGSRVLACALCASPCSVDECNRRSERLCLTEHRDSMRLAL